MTDVATLMTEHIRNALAQFNIPVATPADCYWNDGTEGDIAEIIAEQLVDAGWTSQGDSAAADADTQHPAAGEIWVRLFAWVAVNEQRREHDLPIIERMWR